jgi:GNAT superfamily N-acetyltransferase
MTGDIELLLEADIPAAYSLSTLAGWNQTEADWRRLLRLEPQGCFCIRTNSGLAATTTALRYGADLAWIGMVLTHPHRRHEGLATRLVRHALDWLRQHGVATIKLDATDLGAPIYERLGFTTEQFVQRWTRDYAAFTQRPLPISGNIPYHFDANIFGVDRTAVLKALLHDSRFACGNNYLAMLRHGRTTRYFGPAIAMPQEAHRLVQWALWDTEGEPLFWDLLPANTAAIEIAKLFDFRPVRTLRRMTLGKPLRTDTAWTLAIAGFEYG